MAIPINIQSYQSFGDQPFISGKEMIEKAKNKATAVEGASQNVFFSLPEVRALTDRIPVAALYIEPNEISLRYFDHAKAQKFSLRDQCDAFGIPWNARKIPADRISKEAAEVARDLPPSVFAQCAPEDIGEFKEWVEHMHEMPDSFDEIAQAWYAANVLKVASLTDSPRMALIDYMGEKPLTKKVSPISVVEFYTEKKLNEEIWSQLRDAECSVMMHRRYTRSRYESSDQEPTEYTDDMLNPMQAGGMTVSLLNTMNDFAEEGLEQHHCVAVYYGRRLTGSCHVASVKENGKSIATIEYSPKWERVQSKGKYNTQIDRADVFRVADEFGKRMKELSTKAVKPTRSMNEYTQSLGEKEGFNGAIGIGLAVAFMLGVLAVIINVVAP